jgi:tetratricopeptide (TPR) repeat protein
VLGQSFTPAAVAALSGRPEGEVSEVLENLVAKQVLARDDDPRSSERGQFVFLQALVRTVAYGTLSRRARKARHVAAARHLEQTWPGEARDIAEVLASHYLEAIDADPEAEDVAALRSAARETLTAAGRAAGSLALGPEADRYLQQAAALAEDDLERASLFEQAGRALWRSGDAAVAEERLRQAVSLYQRNNRSAGGSAAIRLAEVLVPAGRLDEARELLEPFHRGEDPGIDQITRASALAELSRVMLLAGDLEQGNPLLEEALTTLELQEAWAPLATALINRAIYLFLRRRREEAAGILARALSIAERQGLMEVALRARYNLAATALDQDRLVEAVATVNDGLALARERGDRIWESQLNSQQVAPLYVLGRWDEVVPLAESLKRSGTSLDAVSAAAFLAPIAAARGDRETLEDCVSLAAPLREASYIDLRVCVALTLGREALERGAPHEAVDPAREVLHEPNTAGECIQEAYAQCIEAAVQLCDEALMNELIEHVDKLPPALATPLLRAGRARLLADLAHRRGDDAEARRCEEEAVGLLRSLGARPLLARTLAERAARREDQSAVQEARRIYAELGATRRLAEIGEPGVTAPAR